MRTKMADRLTWYQERNRELLEALEAALAVLGDDDLPDNGELSGAATEHSLAAPVQAI
jgi:hypothetical protein